MHGKIVITITPDGVDPRAWRYEFQGPGELVTLVILRKPALLERVWDDTARALQRMAAR